LHGTDRFAILTLSPQTGLNRAEKSKPRGLRCFRKRDSLASGSREPLVVLQQVSTSFQVSNDTDFKCKYRLRLNGFFEAGWQQAFARSRACLAQIFENLIGRETETSNSFG
jgi:hypothetical protein